MLLINLFEGSENIVAFERIAYDLLRKLSEKSVNSLKQTIEYGWEIENTSFAGTGINEIYTSKGMISIFPDKIKDFIKHFKKNSHLRIGVAPIRGALATYMKITDKNVEILLKFSDEDLDKISKMMNSDPPQSHGIFAVLLEYKSNLVHELTHAYDDWVSAGKFTNNQRSKDSRLSSYMARGSNDQDVINKATTQYLLDPIEINARYSQISMFLRPKLSYMSFNNIFWDFKSNFRGWKLLSDDDKKRLRLRLATEWIKARPKKLTDYSSLFESFKAKMKDKYNIPIYMSYSKDNQSINIAEINSKDRYVILDIYIDIIRFADIRKLTISSELPMTPELKELGFVHNRASKKRYDFRIGTMIYRHAREALNPSQFK